MVSSPQHPITTPKGASVLTVILAVIGMFAPFFTSLEAAQLFTAVAVLVIVWLYWSDARHTVLNGGGFSGLILPSSAILIILAVAWLATWKSHDQPKPALDPAPALTAEDVSNLLTDTLKRERQTPQPALPTSARNEREYRIVIEDPAPKFIANPSRSTSVEKPAAAFDLDLKKMVERNKVELDAYKVCLSDHVRINTGLYALTVKAVKAQNHYYDSKDDSKMIADLQDWLTEVEAFFVENKTLLPDFSIVKLANSEGVPATFLGIHNSGVRAWGSMEAKKKALETISRDAGKRSCDIAKKAAVAECVEGGRC